VLYQGEELGMENVDVPPSVRYDEAGRDVARTPMQWDASPHEGFCPPDAEPWLPVADDFELRNVAVESADPDSVLSLYRRVLAFRRGSNALRLGSFRRLPVGGDALAFVREAGSERLLVVVNFGGDPVRTEVPGGTIAVATLRAREGERVDGLVRLRANEGLVVAIDS
jgi:alpha-glucosidase